jgi:hypothetical protein
MSIFFLTLASCASNSECSLAQSVSNSPWGKGRVSKKKKKHLPAGLFLFFILTHLAWISLSIAIGQVLIHSPAYLYSAHSIPLHVLTCLFLVDVLKLLCISMCIYPVNCWPWLAFQFSVTLTMLHVFTLVTNINFLIITLYYCDSCYHSVIAEAPCLWYENIVPFRFCNCFTRSFFKTDNFFLFQRVSVCECFGSRAY